MNNKIALAVPYIVLLLMLILMTESTAERNMYIVSTIIGWAVGITISKIERYIKRRNKAKKESEEK